MYLPPHFEQTDTGAVADLVRDRPLATLVTNGSARIAANHIPLQMVGSTLRGHVARNNDVWRETDVSQPVLAIFHGSEAYITPSWYESKRTTHEVVPTWNYAVVHIYGLVRFVEDEAWLRGTLGALTKQQESARPEPWRMGLAPQDYVARQVQAVVGIEIAITDIFAKWKMSQNRSLDDRRSVVAGLRAEGGEHESLVADSIETTGPDERQTRQRRR